MNRNEFLKKVIRYLLFTALAIAAAITGSKVAVAADCATCPGKGICSGETDCSKFLSE